MSDQCRVCNRKLKTSKSKEMGMGPVCKKKLLMKRMIEEATADLFPEEKE